LDTANLILPPNGVYAARTKFRNKFYRVALNIGFRYRIDKFIVLTASVTSVLRFIHSRSDLG